MSNNSITYWHENSPNILSVTDILIGDMSDINYEFLLINKPIILMSNEWLDTNFPTIGHRISNFSDIVAALNDLKVHDRYKTNRERIRDLAFADITEKNSELVIDVIQDHTPWSVDVISLLHHNNPLYRSNLLPLKEAAERVGIKVLENDIRHTEKVVYVGAHFNAFKDNRLINGFKVHLDHGLKGVGTANVEISLKDYADNSYFPMVDLHLTAGLMGQERTQLLLGPYKDRAIIAGYPKAVDILRDNEAGVREYFCKKLGLDNTKPIVTYASAGELSTEKPGGSLSKENIKLFDKYVDPNRFNRVVKLKYKYYFQRRFLGDFKRKMIKISRRYF